MAIDPGNGAPQDAPRTRFARYEYKYRLPRGLAATVRACVAAHLPHDRYSGRATDHRYDIASLYLDSADLRLCRESLEGQKNRFKLRIRAYDDRPDTPVFLEIKRRLNTTILKDRAAVGRDVLGCLARTPSAAMAGGSAGAMAAGSAAGSAAAPALPCDSPAARQFDLYRRVLAARPRALVRYRREAFESPGPARTRVTFDHDLTACTTAAWQVRVGGGGWRRVIADEVVMEIKFDARFPGWVQDLVHRFQLQPRSVSKYCLGLHAGALAGGYLRRAEAC